MPDGLRGPAVAASLGDRVHWPGPCVASLPHHKHTVHEVGGAGVPREGPEAEATAEVRLQSGSGMMELPIAPAVYGSLVTSLDRPEG